MRFILIDRILELERGHRIRAQKDVDPGEDYFLDHFPGFPVVPGVLLTEMMAQAAGKCLDSEERPRGRAMLANIREAKFKQWVSPPATVDLEAEIRTNRDAFATAICRAAVDGREVASAELLFCFVPRKRFAADLRDDVLERYLKEHEP